MTRTRLCAVLSTLLLVTLVGCGDRVAPTQPPPSVTITGHWTGTISSPQSATTTQAICRSDPVSAEVSQDGSSVSASLLTSCAGLLDFTGRIDGTSLTGTLASRSSQGLGGGVSGFVSSSAIQMTVGHSTKEGFVPVLIIELVR